MGLFGFGRRPRQPGEPPPWFSAGYALYMTPQEWQDYYAMLTGYLCEVFTPKQLARLDGLREAAIRGLLGGLNDGQNGSGPSGDCAA